MADDKYSIDDILAEVDKKRRGSSDSESSGGYNGSVTEIIGGNEIEQALRAQKSKRSADGSESGSGYNGSVTEILGGNLTDKSAGARKSKSGAEDSSAKNSESEAEKAPRARKNRRGDDGSALAAKQRSEEEVNERRSAEISAAADKAKKKHLSELKRADEPGEETPPKPSRSGKKEKKGTPVQPESEYVKPFVKPDVAEEDDIIFHTRGDLVTTETMQLRKQQRIEEINRALLKADREAETPDEMLDSLNPMDSRAKAAEELRSAPSADYSDTLAVAGNDLKRMANGEERVKEYSPVTSRRKSDGVNAGSRADAVLFTPAARQRRAEESLVDALNEQVRKQQEENPEPTVTLSDLEAQKHPDLKLNISDSQFIDTSAFNREEEDAIEAVKAADELAQKKKRKISNFILEDIEHDVSEGESDEEEDDDYDEEEEEIDLDDENVIRDRLMRASKGLVSRLVILVLLFCAALFIALVNQFNWDLGFVSSIISKRANPDYYLYSFLTIGILSFAACSSVISNGFARLVKLRPDADTLCALCHVTAIAALIPYLSLEEYIQRGRSHVYLMVSLAALCFNTISKLCTVRAAQRNFAFVSGDAAKYTVQRVDDEGASALVKGEISGMPAAASMRKTECLCDFIISTYCEDASDRISRIITPITICAAIAAGLAAFLMGESQYVMNNVSWACTAATAIFSIGAAFSGSMTVTLPMLAASKQLTAKNAAILGYSAAESFSDTNSVLVEADTLFPAASVKIKNIWNYNKHHNGSTAKVPIDDAIIYAASLASATGSVLSEAFFGMLNNKSELLKPVSGCVYENNLGVMGWIDRRRVLLGNREHMKSHQIVVPDMKKEQAANKDGNEVIYLAVGGEVCLLFFVELTANRQVKQSVRKLARHGVDLIIKTVDGMITPSAISELFDIEASSVHIIPFELHEQFIEQTKFTPQGSAAVCCNGTFSAFAEAISAAKNLRQRISFGCIMQTAGILLGFLLAVIFVLFTNYSMFNCFFILLYNIACMLLTFGVQALRRIS